jgi:hypothetical protein
MRVFSSASSDRSDLRVRPFATALVAAFAACSLPVHAQLAAPRLLGVDTRGSDTTEFALPPHAVHAPVTGLRLRFDQAMLAADADFRVLRAVPGAAPQTTGCGLPPLGGDVEIGDLELQPGPGGDSLGLSFSQPHGLPAGRYRLIVCESLVAMLGGAFDGDGDGQPGGVAIRDFTIASTPQLDNPGFTTDLDAWSVANLSPGTLAANWTAIDADGDEGSGSLRITGAAGAAALLHSATCVAVESSAWSVAVPATLHLRYRVLAGDVRFTVVTYAGFAGDQGETACVGPGIGRQTVIDAGPSADGFVTHRGERFWLPRMPRATFHLGIASRTGDFDVLIDDVGLAFDVDTVFAARFERDDPR